MAVDLAHFDNPWEHVRLLSDAPRNAAMIQLLEQRAPGNRVVEVGCGTGLLSCIAARLGARKVYAVEPTAMVHEARAMVEANGLSDVVEVLEGRVEDVAPREADVVFSELLNADPFVEGVLEAMGAARSWLVDGGVCCPRRLVVKAALVRTNDSARELRQARAEVRSMASRFDLDLDRLDGVLAEPGPYPHVHHVRELATEPVTVWDLQVGVDPRPSEPVEVELMALEPGPVGGVALWFECELDDGIELHNRPGMDGHWGQLVCAWPRELGLGLGRGLRVRVSATGDGVRAIPVATTHRPH